MFSRFFAILAIAFMAIVSSISYPHTANAQNCNPNYKGACIQPYSQGDVDCGEISDRNFHSVGNDPHRLDRDKDGITCESR